MVQNDIISTRLWRLFICYQVKWLNVVYVGTHLWEEMIASGYTLDVKGKEKLDNILHFDM
jgi:hypothetical protein